MVAFTKSDQSGDEVVTGRIPVIEGLITEPVSKGVDAESGLLHKEYTENSTVDEAAEPVTPAETTSKHGQEKPHKHDDLEVVAVLPDDNWIFIEVGDIGTTDTLRVLFHQHPADVGVEETFTNGVWVVVGVGVAMMSSVVSGPPSH